MCLGEDVGGEGCVLMAVKRERRKMAGRVGSAGLGSQRLFWERKVTTEWGAAPWVDRFRVRLSLFFVYFFSFKIPPLEK